MLELHLHRVIFLGRQHCVAITLPAESTVDNFFSDPYALFSLANEDKSLDEFELAY